jgi:hypothetical protein
MPHHVTAAQAAILQELVAAGLRQTAVKPSGAPVDTLLAQLKSQPVATAAFIGQEGCLCGKQLEHLISRLGTSRHGPIPQCQGC